MTFTASDVLLKAASRIEEEGKWCQGTFRRGPQLCALGAVVVIGNELGVDDPVINSSWNAFSRTHGIDLVDFNDAPGRTAHEVAEAMRQAAVQ